jgi:hypothetical protein
MRAKPFLFGLALAATAFTAGFFLRPLLAPSRPAAAPRSAQRPAPLPPAQASLGPTQLESREKPPLALVVAKIRELDGQGTWIFTKEWEVMLNTLAPADFPPLFAAVGQLATRSIREALTEALYSRWGECDPAGALSHAQTLPLGRARDSALSKVVQGWAYTHPD